MDSGCEVFDIDKAHLPMLIQDVEGCMKLDEKTTIEEEIGSLDSMLSVI